MAESLPASVWLFILDYAQMLTLPTFPRLATISKYFHHVVYQSKSSDEAVWRFYARRFTKVKHCDTTWLNVFRRASICDRVLVGVVSGCQRPECPISVDRMPLDETVTQLGGTADANEEPHVLLGHRRCNVCQQRITVTPDIEDAEELLDKGQLCVVPRSQVMAVTGKLFAGGLQVRQETGFHRPGAGHQWITKDAYDESGPPIIYHRRF